MRNVQSEKTTKFEVKTKDSPSLIQSLCPYLFLNRFIEKTFTAAGDGGTILQYTDQLDAHIRYYSVCVLSISIFQIGDTEIFFSPLTPARHDNCLQCSIKMFWTASKYVTYPFCFINTSGVMLTII